MIRRRRGWRKRTIVGTAVLALVALSAGGCTGITTVVPTPDVTSPVEGVIVAVDATSLADVRGFTLRTRDGLAVDFKLGQLDNPTAFPPGHLAEHQATSAPVLVYFRLESGDRVVYRLEDAPPMLSPPATA